MKNKIDQEEKQFLELMEPESSVANPVFKARLKERFLEELEPKFSFWRLLDSNLSFLAVIAISFITVLGGFLILTNLTEPKTINNTPVFSERRKQEVVEKVAKKTSISALKLLSVNEFLDENYISKPIKAEENGFNLRTTEVTYTPTSQVETCKELKLPSELTTTQLFEYFEDGHSIVKLEKNNETVIVTEFNEEEPISFPISFTAPVSFSDVLEREIIDSNLLEINNNFEVIERTDGQETIFIITDYVAFDCGNEPVSFSSLLESDRDKVIREFILNPDYSIHTVNFYLNEISLDTKLAEVSIVSEVSTIDSTTAKRILR